MIVAIVVISFVLGILLTLCIQWLCFSVWLSNISVVQPDFKPQFPKFKLPQELVTLLQNTQLVDDRESCNALNLMLQFLFRELKETKEMRRWILKKISLEFQELLQKTTAGKLLERITIRDFSVGDAFPLIRYISAKNVQLSSNTDHIEELDILVELEYSGGFQLSIDVDLVLGKTAFLYVKLACLRGRARLQLTRLPYTHWSFSFCEEPDMEFDVESQFQGRPIPQVTNLIIGQLKRTVRKKHTLPNYKMRYKPFFIKPDHTKKKITSLQLCDSNLTIGHLEVTILHCSRLVKTHPQARLYCSVAVDKHDWIELISSRHGVYMTQDVHITKAAGQHIGILLRKAFVLEKYEEQVIVEGITPYSPAATADIKIGDILVSVNGVTISTIKHASKLMTSSNDRCILRIERKSEIAATHSAQELATLNTGVTLTSSFASECVEDLAKQLLAISSDTQELRNPNEVRFSQNGDQSSNKPAEAQAGTSPSQRKSPLFYIGQKTGLWDPATPNNSPTQSFRKLPPGTAKSSIAVTKPLSESPSNSSLFEESTFGSKLDIPDASEIPPVRRRSCPDTTSLIVPPTYADSNKTSDTIGVDMPDKKEKQGVEMQKTKYVFSSRDPEWNQSFILKVKPEHRYLNLCVWSSDPEKLEKVSSVEKDILLGHQTISLMDIALECALTKSSAFQETYSLWPPELRPSASRLKNLARHPGFDLSLCYGDVTVLFKHHPGKRIGLSSIADDVVSYQEKDSDDDGFVHVDKKAEAPSSQEEAEHVFIGTQFTSSTLCHYCGKKIWLKVAFQCQVCDMICHRKCLARCEAQTHCLGRMGIKRPSVSKSDTVIGRASQLRSELEHGAESSSAESSSPPVTPVEHHRTHSLGSQKTVSQEPVLLAPPQGSQVSKSLPPSPQSSPGVTRKHSLTSHMPTLSRENSTEEEVDQVIKRLMTVQATDPSSEYLAMAAKEMGKELYCKEPLKERKEKLNDKISKLQVNIDEETEHRNELVKAQKTVSSVKRQESFENAISKSDEKIQALALMMLHYCSGLQTCLELERETNEEEPSIRETESSGTFIGLES